MKVGGVGKGGEDRGKNEFFLVYLTNTQIQVWSSIQLEQLTAKKSSAVKSGSSVIKVDYTPWKGSQSHHFAGCIAIDTYRSQPEEKTKETRKILLFLWFPAICVGSGLCTEKERVNKLLPAFHSVSPVVSTSYARTWCQLTVKTHLFCCLLPFFPEVSMPKVWKHIRIS